MLRVSTVASLLTFILLKSGVSSELTWRLILGFGAIPVLATFWLRRQIAETPRFAIAQGDQKGASQAANMARGQKDGAPAYRIKHLSSSPCGAALTSRRRSEKTGLARGEWWIVPPRSKSPFRASRGLLWFEIRIFRFKPEYSFP